MLLSCKYVKVNPVLQVLVEPEGLSSAPAISICQGQYVLQVLVEPGRMSSVFAISICPGNPCSSCTSRTRKNEFYFCYINMFK